VAALHDAWAAVVAQMSGALVRVRCEVALMKMF
jgi:hypothetical protein